MTDGGENLASDEALPKKTYHHGDLRAALVDAALEIIEELGPKKLTIRAVASRAGVSHAAPYRHFKDKNELIKAVVERGFELLEETMQAEFNSGSADPLEGFAASGRAYFEFGLNYPGYYRVMFSGDLLNGEGDRSLQHTSQAAFEQMKKNLVQCQEIGILPEADPSLQAVWIISTVHGFISLANDKRLDDLVGEKHTLADVKDYVMSAIFFGLGGISPTSQ